LKFPEEQELLGGRSSSVNSGRSSVNSSGSGFRSGSGSSRSSVRSGGCSVGGSGCGFDSGRSHVGSCGSGGFFSLLTASGQSHGGDQRSQQERLFHACILKRSVKKRCTWNYVLYPQSHGMRQGCFLDKAIRDGKPHTDRDYKQVRATPYKPRVAEIPESRDRCEIASPWCHIARTVLASRLQWPRPCSVSTI
jgi:hypothetical protein